MKSCSTCGARMADIKYRCPQCDSWTWGGTDATELDLSGNTNDNSVALEDITSAETTRIQTRLWDDCLGGGLVLESLVLLGGLPGAGKSTLLLQTAEVLCEYGECIYVAGEESLAPIRARADRLGINTNRRLRFVPALGGADIQALFSRRPKSFIIDSIDSLVGSDLNKEIEALTFLKKVSDTLKAPGIVISQVNKDADFSGLQAKQHAVDVLISMMPHQDERSANGEAIRVMETIKNRNGRAFVESYYEMTEKGLRLLERSEEESDS